MKYEPNTIYHVYNRGINRQLIFMNDKNYEYFTKKLKSFILPHADILCYCLMPNHFHLQLVPNESGCRIVNSNSQEAGQGMRMQKISKGIRALLSSYTRGFNRQENRTGSLFQQRTKSKIGWGADIDKDTLLYDPNKPYVIQQPYVVKCFRYIHLNPVRAKMVATPHEWIHSSALDYLGERDLEICNYKLAKELLGIRRLSGLEEYLKITDNLR